MKQNTGVSISSIASHYIELIPQTQSEQKSEIKRLNFVNALKDRIECLEESSQVL